MEDRKQWQPPSKVQIQKCQRCSQQFCSSINYRRHMRLHRRNLNHVDKDSPTVNRDELQGFWDKLSVEESMEIMSFDEFFEEGVLSSAVLRDLEGQITRARFFLQESFAKAAISLVEIVKAKPSRFPISSQELCSILDEASEKTFLCAGLSESVLKYVSDGESESSLRNMIAYTSYFVENRLVTKVLIDKTAEALKYQELLEEEEDASKRKEADNLEKKRLKKLRKKEQRGKKKAGGKPDDSPENNGENMEIPHSSTLSCERIRLEPDDSPETNREIMEIPHTTTSSCERIRLEPDDSPETNREIMETPHSTTSSCERIRLEPDDSPATNRENMEIPHSTTSSYERIHLEPADSPDTNREIMDIPHSTTSSCERIRVVDYHSQAPRGGSDFHNYEDAEALKNQKLLEEEEDASKRREAAILEKKRLKKQRKKEQRGKKQAGVEPDDSPETNREIMEIPRSTTSSCERIHEEPDDSSETNREIMEIPHSTTSSFERRSVVNYHSQAPRGGNDSRNFEARPTHKHAANAGKVWQPKPKTGISEGSRTEGSHTIIQSQIQDENSPKKDRKREVLIGSITVTVVENDIHEDRKRELLIGSTSFTLDENDIHEKQQKIELVKDNSAVQLACPEDSHSSGCEYSPNPYEEDEHQGYMRFDSHIAQAFHAKRWTEAIESDHVTVALFQEAEPPEVDNQEAEPPEVNNQEAEPPEVDNQEAVPSSNLDS